VEARAFEEGAGVGQHVLDVACDPQADEREGELRDPIAPRMEAVKR